MNFVFIYFCLQPCLSQTFNHKTLMGTMRENNYSRHDPPRIESPTNVSIGIYIIGFYAFNEQTMDYSLSLNLKQSWNDPRLVKKIKKNKKTQKKPNQILESFRFNEAWTKIWLPDTFFRNEKRAGFHLVTIENRMVIVKSNGNIWYNMKITATLSCPMKLHKYPLDQQVCPMMFESFGYTSDVMQLSWLDDPVEMSSDLHIAQFDYLGQNLINCSNNYTGGSFPCLQIDFVLRRDIGYFIIQVFFPTFLIVVISWLSFWISTDAVPARVSLGLLTVLTMTNLSISINSNLPRVSYIKAIDIWMSACLLFVFSALSEYAFVNVASRHKVITRHPKIVHTNSKTCLKKKISAVFSRGHSSKEDLQHQHAIEVTSGVGLIPQATLAPLPRLRLPMDGKARAQKIDDISRLVFPLSFVLFNVMYWIGYIHVMAH